MCHGYYCVGTNSITFSVLQFKLDFLHNNVLIFKVGCQANYYAIRFVPTED